MMSLSEEWAILSSKMYGQEYIEELAELLSANDVESLIECGCGDGNVLKGLANEGFSCVGIDGSAEMISRALKYNNHPNISYHQLNWLELDSLSTKFDAVICRGNSLCVVNAWEKPIEEFDPENARKDVVLSINKFFEKISPGGLIYIDITSRSEIERGSMSFKLKVEDIDMDCIIDHDWNKRLRTTTGAGTVCGTYFSAVNASLLMDVEELEEIITQFKPSRTWRPEMKYEVNYDVLCVKK